MDQACSAQGEMLDESMCDVFQSQRHFLHSPCYSWIADLPGSLDRPPPFEAPVPEDSMLHRRGW